MFTLLRPCSQHDQAVFHFPEFWLCGLDLPQSFLHLSLVCLSAVFPYKLPLADSQKGLCFSPTTLNPCIFSRVRTSLQRQITTSQTLDCFRSAFSFPLSKDLRILQGVAGTVTAYCIRAELSVTRCPLGCLLETL